MAVQEITYNDIKSAILEALSEHDSEVQRYGSADTKLRAETRDLTLKLLNEIKSGFKQDKDSDDKLIKEIKKAVNLQEQQAQEKTAPNSDSNFVNNDIEKWNQFLDKSENFLKKTAVKLDGFFDNMTMKFALSMHAMSNDATDIVASSVKSFNTNGIGQDWDEFRKGLRDSKIQLEDLNKALEGHSQAFGTLNKVTGNAAGTYQKLATKAAEYATNEANLAYDSSQTTEALNAYLEMQRSAGNLDRLNEKEMQNGINKLMKSADELAKEFGVSRDALLKNLEQPKDDLDIALMGQGKSADEIAAIKLQLQTMKDSGQTELADLAEKMITSGGTDREAWGKLAYLNSATMSSGANDLATGNILQGLEKMQSKQAASEMAELIARQGESSGIMNIHGGSAVSGANKLALQASRASQTRGGKNDNKKTDETIVKKQAYDNEKIAQANINLYTFSKTAKTANHYFDTMTSTLKVVNSGLKKFGDLLESLAGFAPGLMGWGSALLQGAGAIADIVTAVNSFRTGGFGGSGRGRAGGIKRTLRRANLRTKPSVRKRARSLRKSGGFGLKPRVRGRGILGVGAAVLGGIGLSSLFGGRAEAAEDENIALDTAADVADVADMADSKAPKEAKKAPAQKQAEAPKPKKKSWLGRMKDKVKNVSKKGWTKLGKAGKWLGKAGKWVGKIGAKVGKFALKKIPGLSLVGGAIFAAQRALAGDWTGALGELASGAAACIPGAGTAISCAIDAGMMARDVAKEAQQVTDEAQANQETIAEATAENQQSIEEAKAQIEETKAKVEENTETSSDTTDTQDATKEYTELTSQIAGNSLETNQILEKILIAIENNNRTNI